MLHRNEAAAVLEDTGVDEANDMRVLHPTRVARFPHESSDDPGVADVFSQDFDEKELVEREMSGFVDDVVVGPRDDP